MEAGGSEVCDELLTMHVVFVFDDDCLAKTAAIDTTQMTKNKVEAIALRNTIAYHGDRGDNTPTQVIL